jgi:hypothetical protein
MKKILCLGIVLGILGWTGLCSAFQTSKAFKETAASGSSIWQIDSAGLKPGEQLVLGVVGGASAWTSGTTLTVYAASCSEPLAALQLSGVSALPNLDWKVVMWKIDVSSGVTQSGYPLEIPASRYPVVKAVTGISHLTFNLEIQGLSGVWSPPSPLLLQESVYSISALAASSPFTVDDTGLNVPDGAGCAVIQAPESGHSVYFTTASSIDRSANMTVGIGEKHPIIGNKVELQRWRVGEGVTGTKPRVYYWTRSPY